jgi:fucose permease
MLYSGVEASIGSWMPLFAARYGVGPVAAAQWIISLFWLGLIAGRLGLAAFVTPARERLILRCSLACSAGCLTLVLAFPTSFAVSLGSALMGVCLGPIFPLILAAAIEHRLQARSMGVVLGACGLGSAILPSFIGFISNLSTLRLALGVPVIALLVLLASQLRPRTEAHRSNVQWEQHPTRGQTPEML